MKIIYQEHCLDEVLKFFSDRFRAKIHKVENFVDAAKNKVIFKLYVEEEK